MKSRHHHWALLAILLVTTNHSVAQDALTTKVDEFVSAQMKRQKIPGISLAIVKNGKPLIVKGYGLANIEHNVPVKPETIFQSGSVGKQFTSMAVMILVEDGKIGLDEKISKYLGDVPDSWKGITIRHLLTHTSGTTDYPANFDFRRDYTEAEFLKFAKEVPVAFAPGEKWQYSNLGYVLLGIIVGKVSGKFYGDFLQERVFKPLGMTTARIISEADIIPNRSAGYRLVKGELKNQEWVSPSLNTTADGALYLTALDMMKWDAALESGKLISKAGYEAMWKPVKLNSGKDYWYGFGWIVKSVNGSRVIEHGGAWQGFKSFIARYPDKKLTVILFANLENMDPGKFAHGIAEILEPTLIPKRIIDPDPKATAELKSLFEKVIAGTVDKSAFSPELQKALFSQPDRLFEFVKGLGPMNKFLLLERTTSALVTYTYQIEYAEMSLRLVIARDTAGKVVLFGLDPS
jgi:CubicO group peptidase (beta-lactamase class C family)